MPISRKHYRGCGFPRMLSVLPAKKYGALLARSRTAYNLGSLLAQMHMEGTVSLVPTPPREACRCIPHRRVSKCRDERHECLQGY